MIAENVGHGMRATDNANNDDDTAIGWWGEGDGRRNYGPNDVIIDTETEKVETLEPEVRKKKKKKNVV